MTQGSYSLQPPAQTLDSHPGVLRILPPFIKIIFNNIQVDPRQALLRIRRRQTLWFALNFYNVI